ncbi:hypothetical protein CYY_002270 [Polysphondylium violaceum]|uniref:Uncharacterized protein n=1 Tax=Polysphondylium violaceum TaxID=133409 RepID=A0A8J4PX23_9MYCE|nr:hypothetical protein CYY_002270 [Polysphondylium violaceum]
MTILKTITSMFTSTTTFSQSSQSDITIRSLDVSYTDMVTPGLNNITNEKRRKIPKNYYNYTYVQPDF